MRQIRHDDVVGLGSLAGPRDHDRGEYFEGEKLIVFGVEALYEDGLGFWHEDQVKRGLNLKD